MPLTSFFPAKSQTHAVGLAPINMARLGHVVVLAGRNGAGKTRALDVLRETLKHMRAQWATSDDVLSSQLDSYKRQLERDDLPQDIEKSTRSMVNHLTALSENRKKTRFEGVLSRVLVIDYTPSPKPLVDPATQSRGHLQAHYTSVVGEIGMPSIVDRVSFYIEYIATLSFNASHPETRATAEERTEKVNSWISLRTLVEKLLPGAALGRSLDGDILLFGLPIGKTGLSDGQRALLRVAVALHAQSAKLDSDEVILILDEPENHLHPDALIEFIERLIRSVPKGQIWIATHSIHILSHVEPEALWFVENGRISWAGRSPERVLRTLVGDDERVGRLERFIHLPPVLAMERFASECLLPPAIVMTGAEDRQSNQIRQIIETKLRVDRQALRVLDYGAGRGRILATLGQDRSDLSARIDYRAFELCPEASQDCVRMVADTYGISLEMAQQRVYQNEDTVRQKLNAQTVDVAIMCNVLHEIPPTQWRRLFTEQILTHALKENGYLLILEDMGIPHGENAHKHGFILLDTEQLQTLFAVDREDLSQFLSDGESGGERLKAHLIRADALRRVTAATVKAALERRLASAGDRIQELRGQAATFAHGRLLALYTMLYANAALALRDSE